MSKRTKFYAVHRGSQTGVFDTWADCEIHVKNFPGARYRAFFSRAEAEKFVQYGPGGGPATPAPASASPVVPTPGPSKFKPAVMPSTPRAAAPSTSKAAGKRPASEMQGADSEGEWDVVYTDGACSGNGKAGSMAGVGVWYGMGDERNLSERCPGDQTNNRAELIAIARVLETFPYKRDRPLKIMTDSKYSIQCFRDWIPNWRKRDWRKANGEPVLNVGLIKYIDSLLEFRSRLGHKVRLEHVRGHSGVPGNEGADKLAVAGYSNPVEGERDWKQLERDVRARIAAVEEKIAEKRRAPVEVAGTPGTPDSRTKFQRVDSDGQRRSSGQHQAWDSPTLAKAPETPMRAPETPTRKVLSPGKMVSPEEVNIADFEGCFVDDEEELSNEINSPDTPRTACKVAAVELSSQELEAYASGLLDDDDLAAELSD
ncbi:ribonuclease H-like domain-containing protein [Schizophyllum commune]